MANYETLKAAIQSAIKQNGNNEITGALLQQSLISMINSLGAGYQFAGIAKPSTNPGTPDQNVFYLASSAGTYVNFGSLILADGEVAIFKYNGTWVKEVTGEATAAQLMQLGQQKVDKKLSRNLLDLDALTPNTYFNTPTGITNTSADYAISDFFSVEPSTQYYFSATGDSTLGFNSAYFICYDANKEVIDGVGAGNKVYTTPANAAYMRVSIYRTRQNGAMVNKGSSRGNYEPYDALYGYNFVGKDNVFNLLYTASAAINKMVKEALLQNTNDKNVYFRVLTAGNQVVLTDESLDPSNGVRLADGTIDTTTGICELAERNSSGVSGYLLFNTEQLLAQEAFDAKFNDVAFVPRCSPFLFSYANDVPTKSVLPYFGKKFYSFGDSIVYQDQWQNRLAQLTGMKYQSAATRHATYPLGVGGATICPKIQVTTTNTGVKAMDGQGNQLQDGDGNPLYFVVGKGPGQSLYMRADYFNSQYSDAEVVVMNGGQNDDKYSSYPDIGAVSDAPYEGKEYVIAKYAVVAKYYGGANHSIAILDDGSATLDPEYTNGDYTILTTAPTFAACISGLYKKICTALPSAYIFAFTQLPYNGPTSQENAWRVAREQMLKEVLVYNHINFVDLHSNMSVNQWNFSNYFTDNYHPNAVGGARMADLISRAL